MCSSARYRLFGNGSKPQLAKATIFRLARGGKDLSEEEKIDLKKSEGSVSAGFRVDNIIVDGAKDAKGV
jgi:hypothetical protein